MTSLDAADAAMTSLAAALKVLEGDLNNGIVDPEDVEALAAQLNTQAGEIVEAISVAKAARGK